MKRIIILNITFFLMSLTNLCTPLNEGPKTVQEFLNMLDGEYVKGSFGPVGNGISVKIDIHKKEFYYLYTLKDCTKKNTELDPVLNFYITDWTDIELKGDTLRIYGKIRYGSYKHGAIGKSKNRQVIPSPEYGVIILKYIKGSQDTFFMILWGTPDLTANTAFYKQNSLPNNICGEIAKIYKDWKQHSNTLSKLKTIDYDTFRNGSRDSGSVSKGIITRKK